MSVFQKLSFLSILFLTLLSQQFAFGQTNVTLNTKFGSWNYADIGNTLQPRMPWYTSTEGIITTDDVGTGWWWGTLITAGGWGPSPWIEAGPGSPGVIWYWVR